MVERPANENGMFFVGMKFNPTNDMKQSDLNRLVPYLLRLIFQRDGSPLPVKEFGEGKSMLTLIQFLVDLEVRLTDKAFEEIPPDLRKFFLVEHRDGLKHQYGRKPRQF